MDLRTEHQKMRDKREKKVCDMYTKLKAEKSGSDHQIMMYIATECSTRFDKPITEMGVKYILKKNKLYESAAK